MKVHEASLSSDLQGSILKPAEQTGWGVVVLAGSSGRVDVARAKLFAGLGAVCIALRYCGGERQPPGICEVPLEVFTRATDRLIEEGCERVAYVGTSKGAEAALLIATDDPRVRVVAAISPSSVVWANTGPGIDGVAWPQRSSWTRGGVPLPFIK
ncbi:MAG TPA: acyl-CoA thioesterase, partial [Patescibacteria group bacterium]|nr:acyl-CoA thioesterase [Patescibacteria group bacterium]